MCFDARSYGDVRSTCVLPPRDDVDCPPVPCRQVTIVICALPPGDVIRGLCLVGRRRYAHSSILVSVLMEQRQSQQQHRHQHHHNHHHHQVLQQPLPALSGFEPSRSSSFMPWRRSKRLRWVRWRCWPGLASIAARSLAAYATSASQRAGCPRRCGPIVLVVAW